MPFKLINDSREACTSCVKFFLFNKTHGEMYLTVPQHSLWTGDIKMRDIKRRKRFTLNLLGLPASNAEAKQTLWVYAVHLHKCLKD